MMELLYSMGKDLIAWFRRKNTIQEIEPFCPIKTDLSPLFEANWISIKDKPSYKWIRPRSVMEKTALPGCEYEIVYVVDKKMKTKRKIVILVNGQIDLVLIKKKDTKK